MATYILDRRSSRKLKDLWKPEYDALAQFNSEKSRGIQHEKAYIERMAEAQRDYDENYLPASRVIREKAHLRRLWFT